MKVQKGNIIEITERLCGSKVQPRFKVGSKYVVAGTDTLKDGTLVVLITNPKRKRCYRINEKRFKFKVITVNDIVEENLRQESKDSAKQLQNNFTIKEQMGIAFVPLIFHYIAFKFAEKARRLAAEYRIDILKKLCRAFDYVKTEYHQELSKDLDYRHIKHFDSECERFMEEYASQFTIIYYTVNNTFRKLMPDYPYDDLRTYAIMAIMFIKQCDKHNERMDKMIAKRVGGSRPSVRMNVIDKLYSIADAYAGDVSKFDYSDTNIVNCMNLIENKISDMEFDVL